MSLPAFVSVTSSDSHPQPSSASDSTRQLCASVFRHGSLRAMIRELVGDDLHAQAPELGLDLALLAGVSSYADSRQLRYDLLIGLFGLLGWIALLTWIPGQIVVMITVSILWFRKFYEDRYSIPLEYFSRAKFDIGKVLQRFGSKVAHSDRKASSSQPENVIVYSGFSPFVGAGLDLGGWSFAVDTSKAKPDCGVLKPSTFTTGELYCGIERSIIELKLEGLSIEDRLFIRGRDVGKTNWMLPEGFSFPHCQADSKRMEEYVGTSDRVVRHYKWIRILDWGGEMAVSYFLRFSSCAATLFIEGNLHLLTPLAEKYRACDRVRRPTPLHTAAMCAAVILFWGPIAILLSLLHLLERSAEAYKGWTKRRQLRREAQHDPEFDFGRAQSLRERLAQPAYEHHFQKLDKEMYVKVVEKRILDTIVGFLDEHNIDTSDLRDQKTTIINSGLIVHGQVSAEAVAVGPKAAARVEKHSAAAGKAA